MPKMHENVYSLGVGKRLTSDEMACIYSPARESLSEGDQDELRLALATLQEIQGIGRKSAHELLATLGAFLLDVS